MVSVEMMKIPEITEIVLLTKKEVSKKNILRRRTMVDKFAERKYALDNCFLL